MKVKKKFRILLTLLLYVIVIIIFSQQSDVNIKNNITQDVKFENSERTPVIDETQEQKGENKGGIFNIEVNSILFALFGGLIMLCLSAIYEFYREIRGCPTKDELNKLDSKKVETKDFDELRILFDELKKTVNNYTEIPVDRLTKANKEMCDGNLKIAEIYLEQELFRDPKHVNAWIGLARVFLGLERFKEALESINTALKLESRNPRFDNWGQVSMIKVKALMNLNEYKEAKALIENDILVKNPDYEEAKELLEVCKNKLK